MRNFFLVLSFLALSACQTLPSAKSDSEYANLLAGTWAGEYPEEGGVIVSGQKTYNADGTALGYISYKARTQAGQLQEIGRIEYTSKWKIQDGIVLTTDVVYSDGSPSTLIRDKIISIGAIKAVFRDLSDGSEFERTRVK